MLMKEHYYIIEFTDYITININTFAGTASTIVPHYALYLSLQGIED